MLLEIKKVARTKNNSYGNFLIRGNESALITISLEKNKTLAEYAATLLHEMLHAYTTLLRAEGFRATNKTEHKWIESCETAIITLMTKIFPRKEK